MGKRSRGRSSNRGTRSVASLPRGLPVRPTNKRNASAAATSSNGNANPFEVRANKRLKHTVLNRRVAGSKKNSTATSALARSVQTRREEGLRRALRDRSRDGTFVDNRIGEAGRRRDEEMPREEMMLRRLVRERVNRSRRSARFDLNDDEDDAVGGGLGRGRPALTHGGRVIDDAHLASVADLGEGDSDDDDDGVMGEALTRADTEMHFGGGSLARRGKKNPYGPSFPDEEGADLLGEAYRSRKTELDDLIERRRALKAERMRRKETQVDAFEEMDDRFADLARLLKFRGRPGPDGGGSTDAKEEGSKVSSSSATGARKERGLGRKDEKVPDLPGGDDPAGGDTMDDWQMEARSYLFEKRVRATDRTKTPEEMAHAEAERLHVLERRRLARMNGDFGSDDDLSDVESSSDSSEDDDGDGGGRKRRRRGRRKGKAKVVDSTKNRKCKKGDRGAQRNPEELDSSDDDDGDEPQARFTADGLVYVDSRGNVVKKKEKEAAANDDGARSDSSSGSEASSDSEEGSGGRLGDKDDEGSSDASAEESSSDDSSDSDEDDDQDSGAPTAAVLSVGTRVKGNYRAKEQFEGRKTWYDGVVVKVSEDEDTGGVLYDLEYDDGDREENMEPENVIRAIAGGPDDEAKSKDAERESKALLSKKRKKAREEARKSMPFVFEVPTTLEALHDTIATHASTGRDASTIIQRIHAANSVRIDRTNREKMQNFYDVLLRRFIAVGDAIHRSGDGGAELGRCDQLDRLTKTLYDMAQDSPDCAGAVWRRRLGVFQKALAKRLRDAELLVDGGDGNDDDGDDDGDDAGFTAWPSVGEILLLRALGHVFPVTDLRHSVVTPALLFLGQAVAQAPVRSTQDVVRGMMCAGLMVEYTREAGRIAPEAIAFVAGVLRLFAEDALDAARQSPIPSLAVAVKNGKLDDLRQKVQASDRLGTEGKEGLPKLSLESMENDHASISGLLCAALHLSRVIAENISTRLNHSEAEVLSEITRSLLLLRPMSKGNALPSPFATAISLTAGAVAEASKLDRPRLPLLRRSAAKASEAAMRSVAPRMEDPSRYAMSKDKGKSRMQAQHDRLRREYKREHKAAARDLRVDAAFIESERSKEKEKKDSKAREKRYKNFAWLEQDQATINQQVRMGGGLLKGGGIGTARSKAASAKLGIKKGGKMR